jgi:hypothetical protein
MNSSSPLTRSISASTVKSIKTSTTIPTKLFQTETTNPQPEKPLHPNGFPNPQPRNFRLMEIEP